MCFELKQILSQRLQWDNKSWRKMTWRRIVDEGELIGALCLTGEEEDWVSNRTNKYSMPQVLITVNMEKMSTPVLLFNGQWSNRENWAFVCVCVFWKTACFTGLFMLYCAHRWTFMSFCWICQMLSHFISSVPHSESSVDSSVPKLTRGVSGQIKMLTRLNPQWHLSKWVFVRVFIPMYPPPPKVILWPEKLIIPSCPCCYFRPWGPAGLGVCVSIFGGGWQGWEDFLSLSLHVSTSL